jgi:hypothetical protein
MPSHIQYSETILDCVTLENLERDDEGILHEILVDRTVEDVDGAIVGRGCKEWVGTMIRHGSEGFGVISVGVEKTCAEKLVDASGFPGGQLTSESCMAWC